MNIFFLHFHIAIFLVSFLGAGRIRQLIKVIKTQFLPIRQFLNFQHSGRHLRANRMLLNRRIYTVGFYFSWEIIKTTKYKEHKNIKNYPSKFEIYLPLQNFLCVYCLRMKNSSMYRQIWPVSFILKTKVRYNFCDDLRW